MRILTAFLLLAALPSSAAEPAGTLRLDLVHTGTASEESFALERVVLEPLPWPGNPRRPIDDLKLGLYFFEVSDAASGTVLYSRGFASIFGEWQTTDEAKGVRKAFPESLRFPAPEKPFEVRISKRLGTQRFALLASFRVDPADPLLDRSRPPAPSPVIALQDNGPSADKVDLLLLGDGYTVAEQAKFERDARRLTEVLFAQSPFKERRSDFNVWAFAPPAAERGVSRPSTGLYRRSPVGATYDAFGSERYMLSFDDRAFRTMASFAPYDFVEILANSETYGGGGIYQLYGTVAADNAWAPYVFVHEFGHHFAALADEYYTSPVAYETGASGARPEPWERNVTADPTAAKWKDLQAPDVPLPTPWKKAEFETFQRDIQARRKVIRAEKRPESEMDALFREERAHSTELLGHDAHSGKVGAFEGAMYEAQGLYRSQEDCTMFTRDEVGFCAVCRRALEEVMDLYSRGPAASAAERAAVAAVLDGYHQAAAKADEATYFSLMAPTGVFLGTDAAERWEHQAFRSFAHPHFASGKGWTFVPRDRHVDFSADGNVAWFDELLDSASYGECRGSGVVEKIDGGWKIQQYNLSIPMPNDLAKEFVARIRELQGQAEVKKP